MDITTGLAAINGSLQLVRAIQGIDKSLDEAEYKIKIADLYSTLADAKMALTDTKEEIHAKDLEIVNLLQQLKERDDLVVIDGFSFTVDSSGEPFGLAFCPSCEGGSCKRVQLIEAVAHGRTICPVCDKIFDETKTKQNIPLRESQSTASTVRIRRSSRYDNWLD